ncbi:MAG TPA: glycine betaine ABC transporter substrate-binding protein [Pseudolabrys sp.]|nr:glycine betaine ABC transporter substrate-binding protein [Pseudolabrys sp.]
MSKLTRLVAAVLVGAMTLPVAAAAQGKKQITIGWTAWSDAEAVTQITKQILQQKMGYKVKLELLAIALQYSALAKGDIDMMEMAWLPKTHADYYAKVKNKVEDLGVLYGGASLGWVVPTYVPKSKLNSIPDLKKPAVREKLGSKIIGIDPGAGLMRLSKKAVKEYGLTHYNLVASSGAGMTAALKRAYTRKKWIVVTGWRPHWMFGAFKLRYLKDPKNALGGKEQIHALARKGFKKDDPKVAAFISRINIPLKTLEQVMYNAQQTSYPKAAAKFIKNHPKMVNYWITGKK